jgi:hypothetical protein
LAVVQDCTFYIKLILLVLNELCKAGLLRRYITPFLDNRLLDFPWVGSGPGADLLWDINTLLYGLKFGH